MIFSHRFRQILSDGRLQLEIPDRVRRKIWTQLIAFDQSMWVQRDPGDNWTDQSSYLEEASQELQREHGWDALPDVDSDLQRLEGAGLKTFLLGGRAAYLFDFVQIFTNVLDARRRGPFQEKVNAIFLVEGFHWRLAGNDFFKLDADFMGASLAGSAHDALTGAGFHGAVDEFATAQRHLTGGDAKDAILYAGKSFESSIKTITGLKAGNASVLLKALVAQGFIDDLPEDYRNGFHEQVLKILPFLRNALSGHGQGDEVVQVPAVYAELAVQLAAALQNFLITKHIAAHPVEETKPAASWLDGDTADIPF